MTGRLENPEPMPRSLSDQEKLAIQRMRNPRETRAMVDRIVSNITGRPPSNGPTIRELLRIR